MTAIRAAHKALSARMNKSDRADAEGLALLARTGWYREVHIKSESSDRLRLLLGARGRMIDIRRAIEAQARGVLKTYGIRLGSVTRGRHRAGFRDQLRAVTSGDPILETVVASMIAVHEVACAEAATIEDELLAIARDSGLARRLMSCRKFRNNEVRLQLHALAYNLGNFLRTLALPQEV